MSLSTQEVNEIVVYTSFAILVAVGIVGCIIFWVRMKKQKAVEFSSSSESERTAQLKAEKSSKSEKKMKKKKKKTYDGASVSSYESETGVAISETSSLLERNEVKAQSHSGTMNRVLRSTFHSVLSEGLSIILHSGDSYMQVKMTLAGNELRWRSKKVMSTKSYKMNLKEIQFIEWGKQTNNFRKPSLKDVKDENCFSLVTVDTTFDFETSSRVERDALVQGFMLAISDLREKSAV